MYYVTMTDKFLSGWGEAEGKINKLIFECETYDEAETVASNARSRSDMKHINITTRKPYYNERRYLPQARTKTIAPNWYKENFFKEED